MVNEMTARLPKLSTPSSERRIESAGFAVIETSRLGVKYGPLGGGVATEAVAAPVVVSDPGTIRAGANPPLASVPPLPANPPKKSVATNEKRALAGAENAGIGTVADGTARHEQPLSALYANALITGSKTSGLLSVT